MKRLKRGFKNHFRWRKRFWKKKFGEQETAPCYYCGAELTLATSSLEHKQPRFQGGTSDFENLEIACLSCNLQKNIFVERHKIISLEVFIMLKQNKAWEDFSNLHLTKEKI
jgi:hypothetical protein